jgi:glycosyltransferase involved in cell wall biosynthesis
MQDELVVNGFARETVRILPPCVNLPGQAITPVPDTPNLLFVGQLIKGKGVQLLLDALTHVRSPFTLRIAGDGNARAGLEEKCRALGLGDRVEFLGWVPRDQLETLYRDARALVVPSFWAEPFGMIGLEAMHHGRPVVGFAAGGIPDWLLDGENGILVPERDVTALAEGLDRLLGDHGLAQRLGAKGHELLAERFSFTGYVQALELVLATEEAKG